MVSVGKACNFSDRLLDLERDPRPESPQLFEIML